MAEVEDLDLGLRAGGFRAIGHLAQVAGGVCEIVSPKFIVATSSVQIGGLIASMWRMRTAGVVSVVPSPAFLGSAGSGAKRPPAPVVRFRTTSPFLSRMRSTTSWYSASSIEGFVVFGSRT